ncbi:MAG: histidine kinase [Clostridia bacterium]|nr:histidine kinase [Clostridia bacterium]
MTQSFQSVLTLLTPLILQLLILVFSVLLDPYLRKRDKRLLLGIAALLFALIVQNDLDGRLQDDPTLDTWRTVVSVCGYCIRPTILMLFIRLLDVKNRFRPLWALIAANTAVYLTAFFSGVTFSVTNGQFARGPLGWTCHVVSLVLILFHLAQALVSFSDIRKPEALIPVLTAVLIIAATVVDTWFNTDYIFGALTVAVISGSLFYYIWLHLQFAREHERALLSEQRIRLMMSQIQPHFLYNTLSTIQALCRTDPEKAFDTLETFGTYLRQNIDSLEQPDRIPFVSELKHTQVYTEIEMLRFPSIHLEYEIEDDDFTLPALTVQPIVENAIRHGVRIRSHGVVSVRTFRDGKDHVICIRDNGKGFDPDVNDHPDETHIGIKNVRERIERLCGGSLTIDSRPGEGTAVTIRVPEERSSHESHLR